VNLAEARTEVMARGFDYLPPDRLTLMLNNAKNAFEDEWRWPWLEQTVTGPAPLAVTRLKHVYYVQDLDHRAELVALDPRSIAQGGDPIDHPGAPSYWWLDGPEPDETTTINTWPVAEVTLGTRVVAESPELADDADTPLIPARYHPIWIDYAVAEAYKDSDNYAGAQALRADIALRVQDLVLRYEVRNLQHSELIGVRPFSEDD